MLIDDGGHAMEQQIVTFEEFVRFEIGVRSYRN